MLFLTNLYQISWGINDSLKLDNEEYKTTPDIMSGAKIVTKVHSIMIGVCTVIAYLISEYLGNTSFLCLLLIVAGILTINTFVFDFLAKILFRKRLL